MICLSLYFIVLPLFYFMPKYNLMLMQKHLFGNDVPKNLEITFVGNLNKMLFSLATFNNIFSSFH